MSIPPQLRPVRPEDLLPLKEYDLRHEERRRRMAELRAVRLLRVGRHATLVFENRETVLFQIQETLRAKRISERDEVLLEVDLHNQRLPKPGELAATLFLEPDPLAARELMAQWEWIEQTVSLRLGADVLAKAERVEAFVPKDAERPGEASPVYFLKFRFEPEAARRFAESREPVWAFVDHPNYGAAERFPAAVRRAVTDDWNGDGIA